MTNMFATNEEDFNKLIPNYDTDFQMEQLLSQLHPEDAKYPPVKYEFDHEKVYALVDANKDVTPYIDYGVLEAIKRNLKDYLKDGEIPDHRLLDKQILDAWG